LQSYEFISTPPNIRLVLIQFNKVIYFKITKQNNSKTQNNLVVSDLIPNFVGDYERDEVSE
jgi:hypothetical protein